MVAAGFSGAALALLCTACTSIAIGERTLEGTRWHVSAINGQATLPGDRFSIAFARGTFSGRLGCNRASGIYRIERGMLVTPGTYTTEMACDALRASAIPLMTYEQWGFRVLRQPMQLQWRGGGHLILSNSAGSIELMRVR